MFSIKEREEQNESDTSLALSQYFEILPMSFGCFIINLSIIALGMLSTLGGKERKNMKPTLIRSFRKAIKTVAVI